MRTTIIALMFIVSHSLFAAPALPSDSIYHVGGTWQTENDKSIQLASLAGKTQIIALIYTGCSNSCPVIVESMKRVEKKIPAKMRSDIGFVLVSLTPDTDYPKYLKRSQRKRSLMETGHCYEVTMH